MELVSRMDVIAGFIHKSHSNADSKEQVTTPVVDPYMYVCSCERTYNHRETGNRASRGS